MFPINIYEIEAQKHHVYQNVDYCHLETISIDRLVNVFRWSTAKQLLFSFFFNFLPLGTWVNLTVNNSSRRYGRIRPFRNAIRREIFHVSRDNRDAKKRRKERVTSPMAGRHASRSARTGVDARAESREASKSVGPGGDKRLSRGDKGRWHTMRSRGNVASSFSGGPGDLHLPVERSAGETEAALNRQSMWNLNVEARPEGRDQAAKGEIAIRIH